MKGEKIASGTIKNFYYESWQYGAEILHRTKIIGHVSLEERLSLYNEILKINKSDKMYCILDNRENRPNTFSLNDIKILDNIVIAAGVKTFYGATITFDKMYEKIVKLANLNINFTGLNGEVMTTDDPVKAEQYIFAKMKNPTD